MKNIFWIKKDKSINQISKMKKNSINAIERIIKNNFYHNIDNIDSKANNNNYKLESNY